MPLTALCAGHGRPPLKRGSLPLWGSLGENKIFLCQWLSTEDGFRVRDGVGVPTREAHSWRVRPLEMLRLQADIRAQRMLLISFLLFIQPGTPAYGMVLPTFRQVFPPHLSQPRNSLNDMPGILFLVKSKSSQAENQYWPPSSVLWRNERAKMKI